MILPTYAQAITVDTAEALEAELLASVSDAGVSSWAQESPQFGLLAGEAELLRVEQIQRLIIAYTASPQQLVRLRSKLVELGYSVADAAAIATSWVDAALGWYGSDFARIPAQKAEWTIGVKVSAAAAPITIDANSKGFFQASDGTIFEFAQDAPVTLNLASTYIGTIRVRARNAGGSGNVTPGTITQARAMAGLSVDTGASQVLQLAGRDAETDDAAVARANARWSTIGAGWTAQSFDYWIPFFAPTVTRWRVDDSNPFGPGTVGVTIATAAGAPSDAEHDAVANGMAGRAFRELGSGPVTVTKATNHVLIVNVTIEGDGTNPNLGTSAQAAGNALAAVFPLGPSTLDDSVVRAVLLGASFETISVDTDVGQVQVRPNLPGFSGAVSIRSIDLVAPHAVPSGGVLQLTVVATVV